MAEEAGRQLVIPASWMHPDLLKLRQRQERGSAAAQLRELEEQRRRVEAQVVTVEQHTSHKRARIEQLTKELQSLTRELTPELTLLEEGHHIAEGMRNQIYYQKSIGRTFSAYGHGMPPASPTGTAEGCPLSVHGLSAFSACTANAAAAVSADVEAFLRRSAPLYQWAADTQEVRPPYFFDEPCLMERAADGTLGSSDGAAASVCRNAACPYWHRDQLAHVKATVSHFLESVRCLSVLDENLCGVTQLTARLARHVRHADTVTAACALLCESLQTMIALGLHTCLLSGKPSASVMMSAPVLKASDAARTAPPRAELLRRDDEVAQWAAAVNWQREQQQQQLQGAAGSPSAVEAAPLHPSSAAAVAHFQRSPSALSWRCLLAAVTDPVQRSWLARQGIALFPSCPQLHVAYIEALMQCDAAAAELTEACRASCRTLAAQAAASVVAGLDGGQYATEAARHSAYALARVCVRLSDTDAAAALALLAPLLGGSLDGSDAAAASAVLLLPLARQNLTLLMVALRRTGHLRHARHLPLAAVSDVALELAPPDGANPPESGRDALYTALKLVAAYRRDGFDAQLVRTCDGALRLSLLRTFSNRLAYVERVVEKTQPESPLSQALTYGEYVEVVAQQQSVQAAAAIAEALLNDCGTTCTLALLLRSRLRAWGLAQIAATGSVVTAFCAAHSVPTSALADAAQLREALASHPAVTAVEWVSACGLHAMRTAGGATAASAAEAAWAALEAAVPVEALLHDVVAAALHFHVLLQLSGEAHSAALFQRTVRCCLVAFREVYLQNWSALDGTSAQMVGLPHYMALRVYHAVPLLLGPHAEETYAWRCVVLEAAASLGVLHPLLVED